MLLKKSYKSRFSKKRMARIDKLLELSNATCYTKLANCQLDLKSSSSSSKKKKGWSESDWKKHMDLIGPMAIPKAEFEPPPIDVRPLGYLDFRIVQHSLPNGTLPHLSAYSVSLS